MPVRWHSANRSLVDSWSSIRGSSARASECDPPDLSGELDDITDIYRMIPSDRLIILGEGGGGKTFLAVRFAQSMLAADTPDQPVPAIFRLASWTPMVRLEDWLTDQLNSEYWLPRVIAQDLVDNHKVLPVLDGFDEVARDLRTHLLQALSRTAMPLLLTSRREQFEEAVKATTPLARADGIELEELALDFVRTYLEHTGRRDPSVWTPVAMRLQDEDGGKDLRKVLSNPLMLSLCRAIYCDNLLSDPSDLLKYDNQAALEAHLLSRFLPAVYSETTPRRGAGRRRLQYWKAGWRQLPPWQHDDARRWLGYLARSFQHEEKVKGIEEQDKITWWGLSDTVPWYERLVVFATIAALTGGLTGWVLFGPTPGLGIGLVCGAVGGGFCRAVPFDPLMVYPRVRGRAMNVLWKFGVGLLFGLTTVLVGWPLVDRWGWFALGPAGAVDGGLAGGVEGWLRRAEENVLPFLHQEITRGATGGLAGGLVVGLLGWLAKLPTGEYSAWMTVGFAFGAAFGLADAFNAPIDIQATASPSALLITNRAFTVFYSYMLALAYGIVFGYMFGLAAGIGGGLAIGVASAVGINSWGRWLVLSRFWLPLTGRLPWAVMAFLEDAANNREVLRHSGARWQFRHERLRSSLLALPVEVSSSYRPSDRA